jgi:peroxiredoxin
MDNRVTEKQATDFELMDTKGGHARLSDYRRQKNVVLVFNRSLY